MINGKKTLSQKTATTARLVASQLHPVVSAPRGLGPWPGQSSSISLQHHPAPLGQKKPFSLKNPCASMGRPISIERFFIFFFFSFFRVEKPASPRDRAVAGISFKDSQNGAEKRSREQFTRARIKGGRAAASQLPNPSSRPISSRIPGRP